MTYPAPSLQMTEGATTQYVPFVVCYTSMSKCPCHVQKTFNSAPPLQGGSRKLEKDQFSLEVGHTKRARGIVNYR